jgi:actin-related protein
MSSYETLLENYNLEEKYANDSFSNMMACFESLNAFANEDVNFEVVVSLEEAESGKIKDTAGKIKEAAKRTAKAIEKKVSEFIVKIKDALSRFIAKAKITVANKGNAALKKMIGNSELVIGKDIKLKYFKKNKSNAYVFGQVDKAIKKVSENEYIDVDNLRVTVDVLGDNVATSSIVEEIVLKASDNMKVKEAVTKYVDPLLKDTTDNLNNAQKTVNETIKTLKANIKDLKKETASMDKNSEEAKINKEDMSGLRECISLLMKVSTRYINYVGTVLVMGASNASKIALAAVDAKGKSVAGKFAKKEKEEAAATK